MSKRCSFIVTFTSYEAEMFEIRVPDSAFDDVISTAEKLIPPNSMVSFYYTPCPKRDMRDPLGGFGKIGWKCIPGDADSTVGDKSCECKVYQRLRAMWEAARASE